MISPLTQKAIELDFNERRDAALHQSCQVNVFSRQFKDLASILEAFLINLSPDIEPSFLFGFAGGGAFKKKEDFDQNLRLMARKGLLDQQHPLVVQSQGILLDEWENTLFFRVFLRSLDVRFEWGDIKTFLLQVKDEVRVREEILLDFSPSFLINPLPPEVEKWTIEALRNHAGIEQF